jgi:hypothetical protein
LVRATDFTGRVESGCKVLEILGKQVPVAVESDLNRRMAEVRLDRLGGRTLGDQQGSAGMPHAWERQALAELRNGSVQQAMQAYVEHRRLILGRNRTDTIAQASAYWYRHVQSTGDIASGLLIAHDNDTELNQQARQHLAAPGRLHGPTVDGPGLKLQAGD